MKKVSSLLASLLLILSFQSFASDSNGKETTFTVLHQSSDKIVIEVKVGGFQLVEVQTPNGIEYKAILDQGSSILQNGAPDVQKLTASLIIADNKTMEVSSTILESSILTNINIAPSKGNIMRTVDPSTVPFSYSDIYDSNNFFPVTTTSLCEPYIIRDYRGLSVTINAIQYNPITKELRVVKDIIVELTANNSPALNPLTRTTPISHLNDQFDMIYSNIFLNYSALQNQTRYASITESGRMLIICYDAYMSNMKSFVDWKMQEGIQVDLVAKSAAGSTSIAIKTYVQNYLTAHSDFAFLLLIGDAAQLPSSTIGGEDSDQDYGFLAGSDHYPDVIVGRFSASSAAHVSTQVDRTIFYEKTPASGSWYKNAVGIASPQGAGQGYNGLADWEFERTIIRPPLMGYNYSTVSELYEGSQGGSDAAGNPTASNLSSLINSGIGVLNYTGHGNYDQIVTTSFYNSDIDALTNTNKLPFIWIVGCQTGNFVPYTCFAETWARATDNSGNPTGAIASMMSTINQSWEPPMWAQIEFNKVLTEGSTNIRRTFGGISVCGLAYMNQNQSGTNGTDMTDTWTCFGDPSVMVRTDVPGSMVVNHAATVTRTATNFTVNCNITGAKVCLYTASQINGVATFSSASSSIPFTTGNLTSVADDSILVTVTAYNKIPYQGWVRIVEQGVSAQVIKDGEISITPNPASDQITLGFGNDSFSKGSAKIYNSIGQLMNEISFEASLYQTLDISNYATGFYNVVVMLDEKTYYNKVVVK